MRRISIPSSFAIAFFVLTGCAADATSGATARGTETDTSAAELEAAQCSFEAYEDVAGACKTDFEACLDGQDDPEACRKTLEACLPAPSFGGPPGPRPGGKGAGCDDPDGAPGMPGKPPHGGPVGHPAPAEVVACHDALRACLDAEGGGRGPGEATKGCFDTAHECVETALAQAFEARCAEASASCVAGKIPEAVCTKVLARCAAGVSPKPEAPADVRCNGK